MILSSLSTLPSNTGVDTCTSADSTDFTDFTLVRHSGYSDWNKECDVGEVDVGAEEAEYVEEVEYANDGDVQTVEEVGRFRSRTFISNVVRTL